MSGALEGACEGQQPLVPAASPRSVEAAGSLRGWGAAPECSDLAVRDWLLPLGSPQPHFRSPGRPQLICRCTQTKPSSSLLHRATAAGKVWVLRDLKDDLISPLCLRQGYLPPHQLLPNPIQPNLLESTQPVALRLLHCPPKKPRKDGIFFLQTLTLLSPRAAPQPSPPCSGLQRFSPLASRSKEGRSRSSWSTC